MANRSAGAVVARVMDEQEAASQERVELRCPSGKLFAMLVRDPAADRQLNRSLNLVEVSCSDCRRHQRAIGQQCTRVLHRFDFAGQLVETVIVK